ncbi:glycoside hydrolase family 32 protein [Coraliomargarita sp. W4R72]
MSKIALMMIMVVSAATAVTAAELPQGWKAVGIQYGGEGMVDQYQGNLGMFYAEKVPVRGLVLSPEFELEQSWVNLKFSEEKFTGIISLIAVGEEGNYREIRNTPSPTVQGEGWLNDGWFAFDVKDLIGQRVYFQVKGLRKLDDFTLETVETADQSRGPESLDWYANRMMELMRVDEAFANSDPFRPVVHTSIPSGKSWDANGFLFKDGLYHFFYLARPNVAPPFMGHKVSRDLVHWEERMPACLPSHEKGEHAVWSGSAILDDSGRCHIFYTSVGPDRATSSNSYQGHDVSIDAEFNRFEKVDPNMIVTDRDVPMPVQQVRDPYVFKHEGKYYMTITGGKLRDEYIENTSKLFLWDRKKEMPVLMLFESDDLYDWTYRGVAFEEDRPGFFEVSDLFEQDGRWFYSNGGQSYYVGEFDFEKGQFFSDKKERANGGQFYAYRSMTAPDGRRLAISRIKGGGDMITRKWTECYTFVREWWLEDDILYQRPAVENQVLRGKHQTFSGEVDGVTEILKMSSEFELIAEFDATTATTCGLQLRRSDDGSQFLEIGWDVKRKEAWVSVVKDGEVVVSTPEWMTRMVMRPENKKDPSKVKLQVIIDRGLVEVFIDDQKTINRWVEDIPIECSGVAVFSAGGEALVSRLDAWDLVK